VPGPVELILTSATLDTGHRRTHRPRFVNAAHIHGTIGDSADSRRQRAATELAGGREGGDTGEGDTGEGGTGEGGTGEGNAGEGGTGEGGTGEGNAGEGGTGEGGTGESG